MFSHHNAIYKTDLPVGMFAPSAMGQPSKQDMSSALRPKKSIPSTLLSSSAYTGMDPSLLHTGIVNMGNLDSALSYESAGFDLGSTPIYTTQRMLVSHLSDTDGETWTSIFGNAPSATTEEMSQNELVRNLAEKRYGNSEWLANIAKLSTKGLFTEYLIQEAEINRLLGLIMELRQQQMQQEAILSRVMLDGKDKAIENLTEMIAVNAPTFMNARLEKSGDEWHEEQVVTGYEGGAVSNGDLSYHGTPVDMANLPDGVSELFDVLLELIAKHEGGSWNSYNTGMYASKSKMTCKMRGFMTDKDVEKAIAQGGVRLTDTTLKEIASAGKYPICPANLKRTSANGKYQIMYYNIKTYIQKNPHMANTKFTPEVQKKIAMEFFFLNPSNKAIYNFAKNGGSLDGAKRFVVGTWASVCYPNSNKGAHPPQRCSAENSAKIFAVMDKIAEAHKKGNK